TFWINPTGGMFSTAANWNSGVPQAGDTAVFREGLGATYTAGFSGGNILTGQTAHYQTNRLVVGGNDVTFSLSGVLSQADYTVLNPTTAEAGRGTVVGELGGVVSDVATLTTRINVSGAAATIGDAVGATGTLNVAAGTFTLTGLGNTVGDPAILTVGNHGIGAVHVTGGAKLNLSGNFSRVALGAEAGSSGSLTVGGAGSTLSGTELADLYVGNTGAGDLRIEAGGSVVDDFGA